MESQSNTVHDALERLLETVRIWPGVRDLAGDDGVLQLAFGRGVLARCHPDGRIEIPYPRPVAEELVAAGRAERHQALPDSGWVETRLASLDDVRRVLDLLALAIKARKSAEEPGRGQQGAGIQTEESVDESGKESFPASDPPARGRE